MQRIIIKNQVTNETRLINDGSEFSLQPGEVVVGAVSYVQDALDIEQLEKEVEKHGIKWGDALETTIKVATLGQAKPCSGCQKRKIILNKIQTLGIKEAASQIIETFKRSSNDTESG